MNEKILQAREIAIRAHTGQTDKSGKPYILHPEMVADMVGTEDEKIVAWLHDTVEDTDITVKDIREQFGDIIADAVDAMTHREGEAYEKYIDRLSGNPLARRVKLADLTHNMDLNRIENPTEKDFSRVEKYRKAYAKLKAMEKLYRIKTISEIDYGCEGRPEELKNTQVMVLLEGSLGSEKWIRQEDDYLYKNNINEHDIVSISAEGALQKCFSFENVKEENIEEVIEIEHICFPPNEACSAKSMTERVRNAPEYFLILIDAKNGKVAGFINGVCTDELKFRDEFFTDISLHDKNGRNIMIAGVDVRPEYEKRGLAGLMMNEYKDRAGKSEKDRLVLTNLQRLTHFYEKMGFVDLGISGSSWGGEEWHEMELVLSGN